MEACENCGRSIGKLETPRVHGGHVVCAECGGRLASRTPPAGRVIVSAIGLLLCAAGVGLVILGMREAEGNVQSGQRIAAFGVVVSLAGLVTYGISRAMKGMDQMRQP